MPHSKLPPVLDPCCGSRMMYFDKNDPRVLFCDNRSLETTLCDGRKLTIRPDVLCDFRDLPFPNGTFRMAVFDPPHLTKGGENSWIIKKYGKLPALDWKEYLRKGFQECWRVLGPEGTLIFKWSEEQIPVTDIYELFPKEPCYGNLARNNKQIFLIFHKDNQGELKIEFPEKDTKKEYTQKPSSLTILQLEEDFRREDWACMLKDQYQKAYEKTQPGGCFILQWYQQTASQQEILDCLPDTPLFGNRAKGDRTVFLVFLKGPDN